MVVNEARDVAQRLEAERDDARRWAVRLEGELRLALEREASENLRADLAAAVAQVVHLVDTGAKVVAERDAAIQRWSSATYEAGAYRQQRDEVLAALADLLGVVDVLTFAGPDDSLMCTVAGVAALIDPAATAREIVDLYRRAPAAVE